MNKLLLFTFIFSAAFILSGCKKTALNQNSPDNKPAVENKVGHFTFEAPKKSAHYETNTPEHESYSRVFQ